MKKPIKLVLAFGLVLLLIGASTTNWKTYTSPDGQLSLDSPSSMKWIPTENIKNGKGYKIIFGKSKITKGGFNIIVTFTYAINGADPPSQNEMVEFLKNTYQNEPNFEWNVQAITCSNMPATLVNYSYELNKITIYYNNLLVANKNLSWNIQTSSSQKNQDAWTKRVIDSIKIKPKNP